MVTSDGSKKRTTKFTSSLKKRKWILESPEAYLHGSVIRVLPSWRRRSSTVNNNFKFANIYSQYSKPTHLRNENKSNQNSKRGSVIENWKNESIKTNNALKLLPTLPCPLYIWGGESITIVLVVSRKYLKNVYSSVCTVAYKIVVNNLISNKHKWNKSHWKSIIS